jgi:hypothetical protein
VEVHEDAFDQWYEHVHLPDMLAIPGVQWGRRYKRPAIAAAEGSGTTDAPRRDHGHLAVYGIRGNADAVLAGLVARVESGAATIDESLDLATATVDVWQPLGDRRLAEW